MSNTNDPCPLNLAGLRFFYFWAKGSLIRMGRFQSLIRISRRIKVRPALAVAVLDVWLGFPDAPPRVERDWPEISFRFVGP